MCRISKFVLVFLSFIAPAAFAEDGVSSLYYGLDVGNGKLETSSTAEDTMLDIGGAIGYRLTPFLSAEARIGLGSNDNSTLLGDAQVTRGSGLLRLDYSGNNVIAYLTGGFGVVNSDFSGTTFDDDGVVVGAGVELFGTNNTAFSISYTNYSRDKAKLDYTVANIGFRHYFGAQF